MERGYKQVIIESDTQLVVNLCNVDDDNRSEIRSICKKIREISRALISVSNVFLLGMKQTWLPIYVQNKLILIGGDACGLTMTLVFSLILLEVIIILSVNQ
jgi:hypothetical protein